MNTTIKLKIRENLRELVDNREYILHRISKSEYAVTLTRQSVNRELNNLLTTYHKNCKEISSRTDSIWSGARPILCFLLLLVTNLSLLSKSILTGSIVGVVLSIIGTILISGLMSGYAINLFRLFKLKQANKLIKQNILTSFKGEVVQIGKDTSTTLPIRVYLNETTMDYKVSLKQLTNEKYALNIKSI